MSIIRLAIFWARATLVFSYLMCFLPAIRFALTLLAPLPPATATMHDHQSLNGAIFLLPWFCLLTGRADAPCTTGEVWTAMHHRTGDYFALKKSTHPFRGTGDQKKFLREVRAMRTIASWVAQYEPNGGHPNIVRCVSPGQDSFRGGGMSVACCFSVAVGAMR